MTPLAAYVLLFAAVGVGFIFVHLLLGKLIRPDKPSAEKGTIYECGEPTIGSAWIQFDLRFYVVALLFVIFDVEVAFFFPWAEVFGKANEVANAPTPRSAEDYRRTAQKALDLARPGASEVDPASPHQMDEGSLIRHARLWQALARLTDDQFKAYEQLAPQKGKPISELKDEADKRKKGALGLFASQPTIYAAYRKFGPTQHAAFVTQAGQLDKAIGEFLADQKKTFTAFVAQLEALPAKERGKIDINLVRTWIETETAGPETGPQERLIRSLPLRAIQALEAARVGLLSHESQTNRNALREVAGPAMDNLDAGTKKNLGELQKKVADVDRALVAALAPLGQGTGDPTAVLFPELSPNLLTPFTEADYQAIGQLPYPTLRALETNPLATARQETRTLARLAFFEVLVFFGVLLVGFAYLWKRGDLAWVRSTAAERTTPDLPAGARPEKIEPEATTRSS